MAICAAQASHRNHFARKFRCYDSFPNPKRKNSASSLPKTTSTKSVYECAYECAVKCVDESAHDSELDHQPRILKVGSAGRGYRPARVFLPTSLMPTVQINTTRIPKVGRAVKRRRPALVFSNISSYTYAINVTRQHPRINVTSVPSTGNT